MRLQATATRLVVQFVRLFGRGLAAALGAFMMHSVQHGGGGRTNSMVRGKSQSASGCLNTCFQLSSSRDTTRRRGENQEGGYETGSLRQNSTFKYVEGFGQAILADGHQIQLAVASHP